MGRNTQGVRLINLRNDDAIAAVAKVSAAKEEEREGEENDVNPDASFEESVWLWNKLRIFNVKLKYKLNKQVRMRKLTFIMILLFCATATYAQNGKVAQASSYLSSGKLDEAKKLIEMCIRDRNLRVRRL